MLPEDKEKLLKLARDSIQADFSRKLIDLPDIDIAKEVRGVFVTLHKNGNLRGCIGYPISTSPLGLSIKNAAVAAAFEDPRFPPLDEKELEDIKIEISVLTKPELIRVEDPEEYIEEIEIGKDGLYLKSEEASGLLLPQVFSDYNCTPEQALKMTCQKAGLPIDAWEKKPVKIFKFQAEIFSENATDEA